MPVCSNIGYRIVEDIRMYKPLEPRVAEIADSILAGGILLNKDFQFLRLVTGIECTGKGRLYNISPSKRRLKSSLIGPTDLNLIPDRSLILYEYSIEPWDKMYKAKVTGWNYQLNTEFQTFIGDGNSDGTVTGVVITPMGDNIEVYLPEEGEVDLYGFELSDKISMDLRKLMDDNPTISSCLVRYGEEWYTYARGEDAEDIIWRLMKDEYGISL